MTKGGASFRICALLSVQLLLYGHRLPTSWLADGATAATSSSSSTSPRGSRTSKRGECIETESDTYQCFSNTAVVICEDVEPRCPEWQQQGECQKNPGYMLQNCRKSCQSCIDGHGGVSQVAPGDSAHLVLQRLVDTAGYLAGHENEVLASCRNDREECTFMAVEGKCGSDWMNQHCKAACRKC
jgi:hypothetical protein